MKIGRTALTVQGGRLLRFGLILFFSVRAAAQMPVFGLPTEDVSAAMGDPSRVIVHSELSTQEEFNHVKDDFNIIPFCRCALAHAQEAGIGFEAFQLLYGLSDGRKVQASMVYGPYPDFLTCSEKLDEMVRLGECPTRP